MDYSNTSAKKKEELKTHTKDLEEVLKNFREISSTMIEKKFGKVNLIID